MTELARWNRCMSAAEVIQAAMALTPEEEREIAALSLRQVGKDEQGEIDDAWDETIDRRLDELTGGRVQPVSGRETLAMGRILLAQRRR